MAMFLPVLISIISRRLKEGKSYEDFRKAWYHTVGFGTKAKLYSAINIFDNRDIVVMGFVEYQPGQDPMKYLQVDVKERLSNPLDDVIEPTIGRTYCILVSEDDFSTEGKIDFKQPMINGKITDLEEIAQELMLAKKRITQASEERDQAKKENTRLTN
jgi:hypothetical protein